jgi:2-succinyl-6-hydroxy-2,4-cyclohexadiene-1-carboxylate synthase
MSRLEVNGVRLNVESGGRGRPLLLFHGFTGSSATWQPFLDTLSDSRRVIAVDLLGHGRSDSPADAARYRVERQIEDLTALLDQLDVAEYDLLGYSMGGRLAMHLALAHPGRVGRLVLESASPGIASSEERAARMRHDESLAQMLERQGIAAFVDRWERLPLFAGQARLPDTTRETVRQQRLSSNPVGLAGSLRGFGAGVPAPLFDRLQDLPPALVIAGELDEKYGALARRMAESLRNATVAIVPDAGHTVHLERPDEFARLVRGFLESPGDPGAPESSPFLRRGRSPCLPFASGITTHPGRLRERASAVPGGGPVADRPTRMMGWPAFVGRGPSVPPPSHHRRESIQSKRGLI